MRWLYFNPNDCQEAAQHAALLQKIDRWWAAFQENTGNIKALFARKSKWDLPAFMLEYLNAIDSRLMWEFGQAVNSQGVRLVISPEAERWLRPLVNTIIAKAPKLPGWEFYAHRLPEVIEDATDFLDQRVGLNLGKVKFEAKIGTQGKLDVWLASPQWETGNQADNFNAALIAIETLLGEETLDRWIGVVEAATCKATEQLNPRPRLLPMDRFRPTVEALIGSLEDQRPAQFCHEMPDAEKTYSSYEVQPDRMGAEILRCDIFVGITWRPDVFQAAARPDHFDSHRFSRHGETFAYVAIDGAEGLDSSAFGDRVEIEDALHDALVADQLGAVLGGETGLSFSYVEVALAKPVEAIDRIRKILAAGNVPISSWIAFHDTELAREWVGIYGHTPPPPLLED